MNEKEESQKKIKKILWICLIIVLVCVVPIALGIYYLDQEIYSAGVPLLCGGFALFVGGMIYVIVVAKKAWKVIFSINENEILSILDQQEDKEEFFSTDNQKIVFDELGFWCDDVWHGFEEYTYYAAMTMSGKMFSTYSLVVLMIKEKDEFISLPLDQKILEIFKNQNVQLENQEDLDFFKENPTASFRKVRTSFVFQPKRFCILSFAKNKEEKKVFRRSKVISALFLLVLFAAFLGFVFLTTWLSESKSGIAVSNQIGLHWWMKAIFTIALLAAAIFLKKEKWYVRITVVLYLIGYWATLFISHQSSILWECISILVFAGFSIALIPYTKKEKKSKVILAPVIAVLLGLFLILSYEDYAFIEDKNLGILFGVFSGVGVLGSIGFAIGYVKFKKPTINKKNVVIYSFCSLFISIMFGLFLSMALVPGLNFALDFSKPIQEEYTIERLKPSDDYSSAKAVVFTGEKEIEIAITNEEFFTFEVGDKIIIDKYQGAFHIGYYYYTG